MIDIQLKYGEFFYSCILFNKVWFEYVIRFGQDPGIHFGGIDPVGAHGGGREGDGCSLGQVKDHMPIIVHGACHNTLIILYEGWPIRDD